MDENHYNFIKRPMKIQAKQTQFARPVLDRIDNFEKPNVRPNTVSLDRPLYGGSSYHPARKSIKNQLAYFQNSTQKPKILVNSFVKRTKPQKRNSRSQSYSEEQSGKIQPVRVITDQSFREQNGYFSSNKQQEQKAVDSLCHLSFIEGSMEPQEHYLSAWTNSYPIKKTYKKKPQKKAYISTNRSSTCYPVRCKCLRNQIISQQDEANKESEDYHQHRVPTYNFPAQIRRVISYKHNESQSEDIETKFLKESNQEKLIFFRNGIIKHLRKKQQHKGRHSINQQLRATSNLCIQKRS